MIAPTRVPEPWLPQQVRLLRKARQMVAEMLLNPPTPAPPEMPLAPWKAWLFVFWVTVVAAAYLGAMWTSW